MTENRDLRIMKRALIESVSDLEERLFIMEGQIATLSRALNLLAFAVSPAPTWGMESKAPSSRASP